MLESIYTVSKKCIINNNATVYMCVYRVTSNCLILVSHNNKDFAVTVSEVWNVTVTVIFNILSDKIRGFVYDHILYEISHVFLL
jgi:hypothetical protein